MKYLINLFRTISTNCGDCSLVFIGEDKGDFEQRIQWLKDFFQSNGTLIAVSFHYEADRTEAYIEFKL